MLNEYSFWIGLWKSVKNNAVVLGGAALVQLVEARAEWIPKEYEWVNLVIGGIAAYLIKNKVTFKG